MELKTYQKNVIADLARFLELFNEKGSAAKAYVTLWNEKGVNVGENGLYNYRYNLSGYVPDVCLKVPTGGGKTFLAANAIKTIYDAMPTVAAKAVVWLVPSDAILTQTYAALSDPNHDYRKKIDVDFGSRVEVYSKAQLLNGQNFNPTAVAEQLSIFVLSYDSFRASKKEGRKAFQENGNLATFPRVMSDKSILLPETDETALIQVIRSLNPVVIVDESHHATSALSVEMLENFNPCFVLDLTATPKKNSNIISFVDALQLKNANMVKLPVIVYNRKSQEDVYADALHIRYKLEMQANNERQTSGRYIRPIVLFQAQPKNNADSTTYEKIKATLLDMGIPEEQIAIKTADKDELRGVNLRSEECPIRFIITVNALKEGWDCPFAYVLATVANRTSTVDVEQILGRVLRLPDTKRNASNVLNISYVITSSADFGETLNRVVSGLNNAGFSSLDYRAKDIEPVSIAEAEGHSDDVSVQQEIALEKEPDIPEVNTEALRERVETSLHPQKELTREEIESDELLSSAIEETSAYEEKARAVTDTAIGQAPLEVRDKMNAFRMNEIFAEEALSLRLPQFMLQVEPNLIIRDGFVPLQSSHLSEDFTLKDKDVQIDFANMEAELARVDTDDTTDAAPKAWKITGTDSAYYKEWFNSQPSNIRLAHCKGLIRQKVGRIKCVEEKDLQDYIERAVSTLTPDQLSDMEQSPYLYAKKIDDKVKSLLAAHCANVFDLWLEQGRVVCRPNYALKQVISPTNYTTTYPKSLYIGEAEFDTEYERKMVWELSALPNIKWWHRNVSQTGFQINGAVRAYPDIVAMTTSGKILMIETKGDHLENSESKDKAETGNKWANRAGEQYRYFMVFQTKSPNYPGAYSFNRFMEIVKGL